MKYLRTFDSYDDYLETLKTGVFPKKAVIYLRDTDSVIYFTAEPESNVPLYIEALEDLTVSFSAATSYSLDGIEWTSLAKSTATPTIPAGSKVFFQASGLTVSTGSGIGRFTITGRCYVGGNALSMIYGTDFASETTLSKDNALTRLFYSCTTVVDARRLSLPSLTLSGYCYSEMFYNCSSLVNAPELPATALADYCYYGMFYGCTSLVSAPELPATTLANRCYYRMFYGCSSLVKAPELPATTLASGCYFGMFYNCAIVNAPELQATTLETTCYRDMFYNCSSLVNAPELPATTLADYCYYGMFFGCTSLTHAPESLPATTMGAYSYYGMFYGCTSLVSAPELPATTLADSCYYGMFYNCSSLVNAPELPATALADYCYREMFYNCKKLAYIKAMFTTTPGTNYTYYWLCNTATAGTFVKNAAATWNVSGYSGIPSGWTVETAEA